MKLKSQNSVLVLIGVNFLTLLLAIIGNWEFGSLLWVYWGQSVAIGISNFFKMLSFKPHKRASLTSIGGLTVFMIRYFPAFFFAFHYGLFHLTYMIILVALAGFNGSAFLAILLFGVNHTWSYFTHKEKDIQRSSNQLRYFFFPYARVFPMHLIIIFGFLFDPGISGVILFVILKTIADVVMHQVEHGIKLYDQARKKHL